MKKNTKLHAWAHPKIIFLSSVSEIEYDKYRE
jgi:hypothetical protein